MLVQVRGCRAVCDSWRLVEELRSVEDFDDLFGRDGDMLIAMWAGRVKGVNVSPK